MQDRVTNITMSPGESKTLELESRPSTGYEWTPRNDKYNNITVANKSYIHRSDVPGAEVMNVFEITAIKKGSCLLHFELRRPWESEKLPAETRSFRIKVK